MTNNSNSEINDENSVEDAADNVIDFNDDVDSDDDEAPRDIMQDDFEISVCKKGDKIAKIDAESSNKILLTVNGRWKF